MKINVCQGIGNTMNMIRNIAKQLKNEVKTETHSPQLRLIHSIRNGSQVWLKIYVFSVHYDLKSFARNKTICVFTVSKFCVLFCDIFPYL